MLIRVLAILFFFVSSYAEAQQKPKVIKAAGKPKYFTGLLHGPKALKGLGEVHMEFADCGALPDEFDLRPLGLVPPVKDQGQCGSCWAFSKTGSLESAMLGQGKSLNLAEQELVSCDSDNWGCSGGLLDGFSYQIKHGQALETDFPYRAADVACKSGLSVAAQGVSYVLVGAPDRSPTEKEMMCAIYVGKTVPWVTVGATDNWGSPPSSEMTPYTRCSNSQTNHAIGYVGWHTINGKKYFIAKNSWGPSWGDKGYMSLADGCDSFGEEVGYIQVAGTPVPPPTPVPPGPTPVPPGPGPCVVPNIKLPATIELKKGTELGLAVHENKDWKMEWFYGQTKIGEGNILFQVPTKNQIFRLEASASCGKAQSSVKVSLLP